MRFQSRDCRQHYVWRRPRDHICDRGRASGADRRADDRVQPACSAIKPGHAETLRQALETLQNHPGYRPGDYDIPIVSIHEARFVLFDDDTRLAFFTSFDGSWDAYMDDFFNTGATLSLFDATFQHVEGYDGLPDMAALKAFILRRGADRRRLRPQLPRDGQGDPEGPARQRGVPARARRSGRRRGAAASRAEAAARRGCRLGVSDHISGPRALADPIADITDVYAFPSPGASGTGSSLVMNTLPFAQPTQPLSDGLIYRFRLRPLEATNDETRTPFRPLEDEVQLRLRLRRDGWRAGRSVHRPGRRAGAVRRSARMPVESTTASGRSRGRAGTRSSSMPGRHCRRSRPAKLAFTDHGTIFMDGKNVLTLVVEIDCARFLGGSSLVGVIAETLTRGKFNVRIERVGRPGGEEHAARTDAVRPGEQRHRHPRPLQHGGRVPPRRVLQARVSRAPEREPRVLGRARRQDRLADERERATIR